MITPLRIRADALATLVCILSTSSAAHLLFSIGVARILYVSNTAHNAGQGELSMTSLVIIAALQLSDG